MSLQEFIKKNRQQLENDLRCGACGNSLQQCGKYEIVKVGMGQGKRSEEAILCESCKSQNKKLVNVTRIFESATTAIKQVANFKIADIKTRPEQEASKIDQYKKIEKESVNNQSKTPDAETVAKKEKDKKHNNNKKK